MRPPRRTYTGRGGSTSPLTPVDPPPQAQALRGQIQILADSRKSVGDVSSRLVDDRNDLGIGQPARSDDAQNADDLIAIGVGRSDQRALAHLGYRILFADRHAEPVVAGELGHQVGEAFLLL